MDEKTAPFIHRPLSLEEADGEQGWHTWDMADPTRFNTAVLGPLRVRIEDDATRCRLRMFPERRHTNLVDAVHGGATLALIDIALFATMHGLGQGDAGPSVTVELSTQFVDQADPTKHLDAVSEVVRETGRMLFVRGQCEQDDGAGGKRVVTSYSGIVRKMRASF